ncbi:uncharacterized protein [Malus domestica]|uniref:uncharacterized protein n=1 Tax=Malus domestica TaxID=3750 RepID=UPI003976EE0B
MNELFSQEELDLIGGIPLNLQDSEDRRVWHYEGNGKFIVRSAYHVVRGINVANGEGVTGSSSSSSIVGEQFWKKLWSACVPRKLNGPASGFDLDLMLSWALWKHRNENLWTSKALQLLDIVLQTEGWMQEFHKWHKPATKKKNREVQRWGKPAEGWIKCNFDGAWNKGNNRGGFGVVIRNHLGKCLAAAAAGLVERIFSAVHVELFAAWRAAILVCSIGTVERKVQFEGDSAVVLAAMRGSKDDHSTLGLIINDLRCLRMEWVESMVSHIQREGNSAAHRLARMRINSV